MAQGINRNTKNESSPPDYKLDSTRQYCINKDGNKCSLYLDNNNKQ